MSTPVTIYPNPPILAGYPTVSDPPLAAPQPADLDDPYTSQTIREGGFLTAPRSNYSSTPKTGTASSTIGLVITLNYGTALYEGVYQLGAFTPMYSAGSTVNLGTGAYSLVRQGGFPPGTVISAIGCAPCPPCPPIPTGGQAMGAIYDVDFTALPTQALDPAGSYTIDGKVWWAKGALVTNTVQTCGIVNGVGMRMTRPDPVNTIPSFISAGVYGNRVMCFDISQLADYNPLAPLTVVWRVTSSFSATSDEAQFRSVYGTLLTVPANATAVTLAGGLGVNLRRVNPNQYWWRNPINVGSLGLTMVPTQSDVVGNVVQGVYRYATGRYLPLSATWNGVSLPGPDAMALLRVSDSCIPYEAGGLTAANPSFCFACDKQSQTSTTMDFALTHLKIWQPKI